MNTLGPDKFRLGAGLGHKRLLEPPAGFLGWGIGHCWLDPLVLHDLPKFLALLLVCCLHLNPNKEVAPSRLVARADVEVREIGLHKDRVVRPPRLVLGELPANLRLAQAPPANRVNLVLEVGRVRKGTLREQEQERHD